MNGLSNAYRYNIYIYINIFCHPEISGVTRAPTCNNRLLGLQTAVAVNGTMWLFQFVDPKIPAS